MTTIDLSEADDEKKERAIRNAKRRQTKYDEERSCDVCR